jgi:hypothetical protein
LDASSRDEAFGDTSSAANQLAQENIPLRTVTLENYGKDPKLKKKEFHAVEGQF